MRDDTFAELKALPPSPERNALYAQIHKISAEEKWLEEQLQNDFVPQHGPSQFLSPRVFFQSALFRACSRSVTQADQVQVVLSGSTAKPTVRYEGPELRQSDGRVFLALLHMLRDIRLGIPVHIEPNAVCHALFGRYDGNSRRQLRTHLQSLQKGLVIADTFSMQLCKGFEHPKFGPWTVSLDPKIVNLFAVSPGVWLSMSMRLSLSEGLTTWLYSYIESQSRLIPTAIERLQRECGSEAGLRSFTNALRNSLQELAQHRIIDGGWSVRGGTVRWLKIPPSNRLEQS